MRVFRSNKAFGIARSVKAFLYPKGSVARGAVPDVERHEGQGESPKNTRRRTSERRRKAKRLDPTPGRIETAQLRQLPDFVIIGTQRGGTTSLYRYLTEHPDVGSALCKEVHFFDRHYQKGMNWYLAHFPLREEASIVCEASPNYLFHPDVPRRARSAIPYARFIALLRNPIDRAYSQYQMNVRKGIESLSFEDALDKERERLSRSDDPASSTWRQYSYIKRGLYGEQLERWMSVFPHEQFLIIRSEELYADPERVVRRTLAYLGLRPWHPADFKVYHLAEYADMDPAMRKDLAEYFAPHNQRLYALLGRDLGWEHERQ